MTKKQRQHAAFSYFCKRYSTNERTAHTRRVMHTALGFTYLDGAGMLRRGEFRDVPRSMVACNHRQQLVGARSCPRPYLP